MEYIGFQWCWFIGWLLTMYLTRQWRKSKENAEIRAVDEHYTQQKRDYQKAVEKDYKHKICRTFLNHSKVYQNFEQNFYKYRGLENNVYNIPIFKDYCNSTPSEDFIKNAFDWDNSREGVNVWTALDAYWQTVPKDKPFTNEVPDAIGANFKVKWYKN